MNSVEIQALSVEEAVRLALEQLGRSRDEVDVEILVDADPENEGEALVRVTAKGHAPLSSVPH
jgi:spoIIIJ-associated protein